MGGKGKGWGAFGSGGGQDSWGGKDGGEDSKGGFKGKFTWGGKDSGKGKDSWGGKDAWGSSGKDSWGGKNAWGGKPSWGGKSGEEDLWAGAGSVDPSSVYAKFLAGKSGGGSSYGKGGSGKHEPLELLSPASMIDGLSQAMKEAFAVINEVEPETDSDEIVRKLTPRMLKVVKKYQEDDRTGERMTATGAEMMIEEFVDSVMNVVTSVYWEETWVLQVDMSKPLVMMTKSAFKAAKIFTRTISPFVDQFAVAAFERWLEEERLQKAMWAATAASGVSEPLQKKMNAHLSKAFDDAHAKAPYGTYTGSAPELNMLQDFVQGWMQEFAHSAWRELQATQGASKDEQVFFLTVLFQNLVEPQSACVPPQIKESLKEIPASPWPFIAECAEGIVTQAENKPEGLEWPSGKRQKVA